MKNWIFVILLSLLFISCDDNSTSPNKTTVKVGVMLSQTGAGSSLGETANAAITVAMEEIQAELNADYPDKAFEIVLRDTETNPDVALTQLQELAEMDIKFIVGPQTSASLEKMKEFADSNDILLVSPTSVAQSLAIPGDNIYRLTPSDNLQAEATVAMLKDKGINTSIIIVRDDVWGNGLADLIKEKFESDGGRIAHIFKYSTDETDFSSLAADVDNKLSELILTHDMTEISVNMLSFAEGADILEAVQVYDNSFLVKWYGSSAFAGNKALLENKAALFAINVDFECPLFGLDPNAQTVYEPVGTKVNNIIGRMPDIYAYAAYDALWLAARTFMLNDFQNDFGSIKTTFYELASTYLGASGNTEFNENGDRKNANFDFWRLTKPRTVYKWAVSATYNSETGLIEYK